MKPILFNTKMVRAILDGRKTQTRRIVKPQPIGFTGRNFIFDDDECPKKWEQCDDFISTAPYHTGDILWVRETWCKVPGLPPFVYKASCYDGMTRKWHPSIHMPREAARLFLRVTDVRAERLQHITRDDAISEGCNAAIPVLEFQGIWDTTIKKADRDRYGWAADPWVWVYTFERCGKEGESWNG